MVLRVWASLWNNQCVLSLREEQDRTRAHWMVSPFCVSASQGKPDSRTGLKVLKAFVTLLLNTIL